MIHHHKIRHKRRDSVSKSLVSTLRELSAHVTAPANGNKNTPGLNMYRM